MDLVEARASSPTHRSARAVSSVASLADEWSTFEPVVDDVVRRLHLSDRSIESADVLQEATLIVAELLRNKEPAAEKTVIAVEEIRRQLTRRIREYLRSERRRLGRQVTADDETLERALQKQTARGSSGIAAGHDLSRALKKLSPRERAVVAALYFRDQPVTSLATELGITPQAVTALHRRALAAMRRQLADEELSTK